MIYYEPSSPTTLLLDVFIGDGDAVPSSIFRSCISVDNNCHNKCDRILPLSRIQKSSDLALATTTIDEHTVTTSSMSIAHFDAHVGNIIITIIFNVGTIMIKHVMFIKQSNFDMQRKH